MERRETEKIDVSVYVGVKADIVIAEVRQMQFGKVIYLETGPIKQVDGHRLRDNKNLTATKILGLMEDNESGRLYIGIDTKADKFLKAKGIDIEKDIPSDINVGDRIKALELKKVTLQKNDNGFLEIA